MIRALKRWSVDEKIATAWISFIVSLGLLQFLYRYFFIIRKLNDNLNFLFICASVYLPCICG